MLDPSAYPASVCIEKMGTNGLRIPLLFDIPKYISWSEKNNIPVQFSHGRIYFKEEAHAILFKLTFGL